MSLLFVQWSTWSQLKETNTQDFLLSNNLERPIFEVKNTPPCLSDLSIDQNVLNGETDIQDAENTITATNEIFNGGIASYDAGSSVTMAIGFNAKAGSEFRAYIEGCSEASLDDFVLTWKTDNEGTSNDTSITIPTTGGGYNYDVDWNNDGIFDEIGIIGNITHDYQSVIAGNIRTIRIQGNFPRIYFNNELDSEKLITIEQWGNQQWTSMDNAFNGCLNLSGETFDIPNLSNVSDMAQMFFNAVLFNQNISTWNVSNIEDMHSMFQGATNFNNEISNWDTSNVTDFDQMFQDAVNFDQNLGNWNIESASIMEDMFAGVTLSTSNYDALLIGWSVQNLSQGIVFSGGNSKYCAGKEARDNMINNDVWTITDAGFEDACFPDCTEVNNPENGATGISVTASLTWSIAENATGYLISIGTSSGFSDILEDEDLGNITTYLPDDNWEEDTTYFVTITPYNEEGRALNCPETQFTTEISNLLPGCVTVTSPLDGAEELPTNISLSWQPVDDATGYNITIGTTPSGFDVENNTDLGNTTTYTPSLNWLEEARYYVTVTPYNTFGDALNCQETSFSIRGFLFIPNAFTPDGDGINDTFNIVNVDLIFPNYEIMIYDRWGNIVYKGKNGWNGESDNVRSLGSKKVTPGVYYVLIFLEGEDTIKKTLVVEY